MNSTEFLKKKKILNDLTKLTNAIEKKILINFAYTNTKHRNGNVHSMEMHKNLSIDQNNLSHSQPNQTTSVSQITQASTSTNSNNISINSNNTIVVNTTTTSTTNGQDLTNSSSNVNNNSLNQSINSNGNSNSQNSSSAMIVDSSPEPLGKVKRKKKNIIFLII